MKSNHCVFVLSKRYEKGIVDDTPAVGGDLGSERNQRQQATSGSSPPRNERLAYFVRPTPESGPGRIRTCDTRPRKPSKLICDSEKRRFLCGFCAITSAPYHKDRLSALRSVESLGRYSERCSVACGGRAHTRLLGQGATGAQNGSECVS